MVIVNHISKSYVLSKRLKSKKKSKLAVDDLSFKVEKGMIYGLLGPNGAGKTTTLRCIATLLKPTTGSVNVCGYDTVKAAQGVRQSIAFLTNDLKLDKHFTPEETLRFFADMYRVSKDDYLSRRNELFETFGITPFADKKISALSQGMMQKVAIAVSLIHDPEVIVFDEPTNGLDIITAKNVTDYLKVLRTKGKVIIVSTHIMAVAEKLCDEISIILNGKIVISGSVEEILNITGEHDLEEAFFNLYHEHR